MKLVIRSEVITVVGISLMHVVLTIDYFWVDNG